MTDTQPADPTADPVALTYVPLAVCEQFLASLARPVEDGAPWGQFVNVGTKTQCPDCGRTWTAWELLTGGSPVQVQWVCTEPPPADWTPPAPPAEEAP